MATIIGGGYAININIINNDYTNPPTEQTPQSNIKATQPEKKSENLTSTEHQNTKSTAPEKLISETIRKKKSKGLFAQSAPKDSSKKNVSFFIIKNGAIDSKTARTVSTAVKQLNINTPQLFNGISVNKFYEFASPTTTFLNAHDVYNYTDYYFICDIESLETSKTPGMGTYTSALNIEGYLINAQNGHSLPFPYDNLKGAGYSANDADVNLSQDLKQKITKFIQQNSK